MAVTFVGRCHELRAADLNDFDETSSEISNRTFRKHVGSTAYKTFERDLGYGVDGCRLRLSRDRCVDYVKGKWQGKPAVCCFWSAIHHIFLINEDDT